MIIKAKNDTTPDGRKRLFVVVKLTYKTDPHLAGN